MIWCGLKIKENCHVLVNQFHGNFPSKTLGCRKINYVFRDVKWCFNASCGLKGLNLKSNKWLKTVIDVISTWWVNGYVDWESALFISKLDNTIRWHNIGLMLGQCCIRWPNMKPAFCQRLVFEGRHVCYGLARPMLSQCWDSAGSVGLTLHRGFLISPTFTEAAHFSRQFNNRYVDLVFCSLLLWRHCKCVQQRDKQKVHFNV